MSFPRGKGRILIERGQAVLVARCPLCNAEHRYAKGVAGGDEIELIRRRGFSDEWLPCQFDLPGNFWRVAIPSGGKGEKKAARRIQGRER